MRDDHRFVACQMPIALIERFDTEVERSGMFGSRADHIRQAMSDYADRLAERRKALAEERDHVGA